MRTAKDGARAHAKRRHEHDHQAGHQHAAPSVAVGERSGHEQQRRRREQVAGQAPLQGTRLAPRSRPIAGMATLTTLASRKPAIDASTVADDQRGARHRCAARRAPDVRRRAGRPVAASIPSTRSGLRPRPRGGRGGAARLARPGRRGRAGPGRWPRRTSGTAGYVQQHLQRGRGADGRGRLLKPLARLRAEGVGAGEPGAVRDQGQEPGPGVVGARVRGRSGEPRRARWWP